MDYFCVTFKADWYHEKCSGNVLTLDETEQGEMSKGQSRETGNIRYRRRRKTQYVMDTTIRKQILIT
jgi:hypothetical protein